MAAWCRIRLDSWSKCLQRMTPPDDRRPRHRLTAVFHLPLPQVCGYETLTLNRVRKRAPLQRSLLEHEGIHSSRAATRSWTTWSPCTMIAGLSTQTQRLIKIGCELEVFGSFTLKETIQHPLWDSRKLRVLYIRKGNTSVSFWSFFYFVFSRGAVLSSFCAQDTVRLGLFLS